MYSIIFSRKQASIHLVLLDNQGEICKQGVFADSLEEELKPAQIKEVIFHFWKGMENEDFLVDFEQIEAVHQLIYPQDVGRFPLDIPTLTRKKQTDKPQSVHYEAIMHPFKYALQEPFVLLWTDDWCYAIDTVDEASILQDLPSSTYFYPHSGSQLGKVSCIFGGNEHDRHLKHLSEYFGKDPMEFKKLTYNFQLVRSLRERFTQATPDKTSLDFLMDCPFVERDLNAFKSFEEAYNQFMLDLVAQQVASLRLIWPKTPTRKLIVAGKFAYNELFMTGLAEAFFDKMVFAAEKPFLPELGIWLKEQKSPVSFQEKDLRLKRYF
ncbi:MAG: hypothetical protein ACK4UP_08970 [Spirosomataceae bacterium]